MKPVLLCITFSESRANRYVPKPTGGFFREEARIGEKFGERTNVAWGEPEAFRMLENFRRGYAEGQEQSPKIEQPLPECA